MKPTRERPWTMGFGPILIKAGETQRIDAQPKCLFRAEHIRSWEGNAGVHLTGVYVNREELLGLRGDAIDLGRVSTLDVKERRDSQPALPIEIEVSNRTAEDRMVQVNVVGVAIL